MPRREQLHSRLPREFGQCRVGHVQSPRQAQHDGTHGGILAQHERRCVVYALDRRVLAGDLRPGFTVPFGLANGTYFIYTDMDHTRSIVEILEGDNSTVSAKRMRVNC